MENAMKAEEKKEEDQKAITKQNEIKQQGRLSVLLARILYIRV